METIQYSLKSVNTYSININNLIIKGQGQKQNKLKNHNSKVKTEIKYASTAASIAASTGTSTDASTQQNNIFDNYCIKVYGKKTCILFYEDIYFNETQVIEVRFLDKKNTQFKKIKENTLYKNIPLLLENKYTVVIVKSINDLNKKEITDIHTPPPPLPLSPPPN